MTTARPDSRLVSWVSTVLLGGLLAWTVAAPAPGQVFDSKDFTIHGSMTLDATGGPASFEAEDLPRWTFPYSPNRSTGVKATSCKLVEGQPLTAQSHEPAGPAPGPGFVVTMPYKSLCLPSFGGSYSVETRMQLGHAYLGVPCPAPVFDCKVAEDFYRFDAVDTACVAYCPPTQPETYELDEGECHTDCGCTSCEGDCSLAGTCSPPDPVFDQDISLAEDVAMLDLPLLVGPLPDVVAHGSCGEAHETTPMQARIYVQSKNPGEPWQTHAPAKAGTEMWPGLPGGWTNLDGCTPEDMEAAEAVCGVPPTPPDLEARTPIPTATGSTRSASSTARSRCRSTRRSTRPDTATAADPSGATCTAPST
jgi:hypothetical protein